MPESEEAETFAQSSIAGHNQTVARSELHIGEQSTYVLSNPNPKVETIKQETTIQRQPGQTLKMFTPFPRLVAEIRIKISKLNLPAPRTLTIHPDYLYKEMYGQSALSPLFETCFESKGIFENIYPRCFNTNFVTSGQWDSFQAPTRHCRTPQ